MGLASPSSLPYYPNRLDWQLRVSASKPRTVNDHADVRTHDWQAPRKPGDGAQEVAKQYYDAVRLNKEADKRPLQEDQRQPSEKCSCALGLLFPREE